MKFIITLFIGIGLILPGCGRDTTTEPNAASSASADPDGETGTAEEAIPMIPPEPAPAREPLGLVVSVEQLQDRLESDPPRIIDVRPADQYDTGHIPGAAVIDLADWKSASLSPDGLDSAVHWSERIGSLGITTDSEVVVYGQSPTNAARAWWILKYVGVEQVAMLDGGWTAWLESSAATDDMPPVIASVEFTPRFQSDRLARIQQLASEESNSTIIDTRSDGEFNGTDGPGERRGHIPGAVQIEWSEFMTEDGRFRTSAEIQAMLVERGVEPGSQQVVHCQTGGRASVAALALELAGFGPTQNYYCGWSEWSANEDAPIETEEVEE